MRYIGSKVNLLHEIDKVLSKHLTGNEETFTDLFAGTNTVGRYFKPRYRIISNDLLYFSYVNAKATIENNSILKFSGLKEKGINSPIAYLQFGADIAANSMDNPGYYELSYSPTGSAMYFSVENARRIDFIRDQIERWKDDKIITLQEYFYLLSCLIESVPFVSNITGTYGAFLKKWDKRALNDLILKPIEVIDNRRINESYNKNSNELITKISSDIVYIDTPYNNRQYAQNYHVLENIARNDKPPLKGLTKIFDWSELKSEYSSKNKALSAMSDLISKIEAKHIIISYNTEGIICEEEFTNMLRKFDINGQVEVNKIPFRKYKSKKPSRSDDLYEILYYISTKKDDSQHIASTIGSSLKNSTWAGEKNCYLKSPLNYIGGKYRLLRQILPHFPSDIDTFVDLFSGGANVGINVNAKNYIFNDMNYIINEMFRVFSSSNPDELIDRIKNTIREYGLSKTNEEAYKKFRIDYNKNPDPVNLYILSSFSYNYQFRFNSRLEYNNPFGRDRSHFSTTMEKNLRLFIERLNSIDASFIDGYFEDFNYSELQSNDFVYLDPPYLITTASYNDGNRGFRNWTDKQEFKMYEILSHLNRRGIRFALSNVLEHKGKVNQSLINFIIDENLKIIDLSHSYNNSSYNTKNKTGSREVLVINY